MYGVHTGVGPGLTNYRNDVGCTFEMLVDYASEHVGARQLHGHTRWMTHRRALSTTKIHHPLLSTLPD